MANNYTHFSFAFKINNPAEAEYLETILALPDDIESTGVVEDDGETLELLTGELLEVFPEWKDYECLGFDYEIECGPDGGEVWIHDDGGEGNVEFVVQFLQAYMQKFFIREPIAFEFALTCSAPRVDEFGGGAVVVTATGAEWFNTRQWINKTLDQLAKAVR